MKVERTLKDRSTKDKTRATRTRRASSARRASAALRPQATFKDRLSDTRVSQIRQELDSILLKIDTQAHEIEKSLTFETLRGYRGLVQKFMNIVLNELYVVEDRSSVSRTGKKQPGILVKKVNDELDALTRDFLDKQENLLGFLERLDRIRGMLLDLYT